MSCVHGSHAHLLQAFAVPCTALMMPLRVQTGHSTNVRLGSAGVWMSNADKNLERTSNSVQGSVVCPLHTSWSPCSYIHCVQWIMHMEIGKGVHSMTENFIKIRSLCMGGFPTFLSVHLLESVSLWVSCVWTVLLPGAWWFESCFHPDSQYESMWGSMVQYQRTTLIL